MITYFPMMRITFLTLNFYKWLGCGNKTKLNSNEDICFLVVGFFLSLLASAAMPRRSREYVKIQGKDFVTTWSLCVTFNLLLGHLVVLNKM